MRIQSCEEAGKKLDISFFFYWYDHLLILHLVTSLSFTKYLQIQRSHRTWSLQGSHHRLQKLLGKVRFSHVLLQDFQLHMSGGREMKKSLLQKGELIHITYVRVRIYKRSQSYNFRYMHNLLPTLFTVFKLVKQIVAFKWWRVSRLSTMTGQLRDLQNSHIQYLFYRHLKPRNLI